MKIELTKDQAAQYARGEAFVVDPPLPNPEVKRYIVVRNDGAILRYDTIGGKPLPWTILRKSNSVFSDVGHTSSLGYDFTLNPQDTVIEVTD